MTKKKLIIANWKLNPLTVREVKKLSEKIDRHPRHETVLCPPTIFLTQVSYPRLGAQDCFWVNKGPYTGQTSPATLKSLGIKYCLVGHSERRMTGDNDEVIALKIKALLSQKITPVLCIGFGTTVEQDDLEVIDTLKFQLTTALKGIDAKKVVVAYEPVWAISSGNSKQHASATPEHAEKIALFIKTKYGVGKILYGGSVNVYNAAGFLSQPTIDGALIGGASLLPNDFNTIANL